MSEKNLDRHGRWRNITVAFRVSPEEDDQIEKLVKVSGLTKQDYIIECLKNRSVEVKGSPRVYKALRDQFGTVLDELKRIENGGAVDEDLIELISFMSVVMNGMKEGPSYD